jgi:translation initiation factor IF-1
MKQNHIRAIVGDEVVVILDPYGGKATNRIVQRGKKKE